MRNATHDNEILIFLAKTESVSLNYEGMQRDEVIDRFQQHTNKILVKEYDKRNRVRTLPQK